MGRPRGPALSPKHGLAGICLALVCALSASTARADAPLVLSFAAPASCPQQPAFEAEVHRLLGDDVAAGAGVAVNAQLTLSADGQYVLTLRVRVESGDSSRTLAGANCEALMMAGALVVALAIDPEGVAARAALPPPDAPVDPPNPPDPAPRRAPPPRRRVPASPRAASPPHDTRSSSGPRIRGRVLAMAVVEALAVPGVSAAVLAGAGVRIGPVDLTVEGLWSAPRQISVPTPRGAGGRFSLLAGRLRGCVALTRGWLELAPCLGLELGWLSGESYGVSAPSAGGVLWIAPLAAAEARVFVHELVAITTRLDASFPIERPTFVIAGVGAVTEPGLASLRAEVGVSVYFP